MKTLNIGEMKLFDDFDEIIPIQISFHIYIELKSVFRFFDVLKIFSNIILT